MQSCGPYIRPTTPSETDFDMGIENLALDGHHDLLAINEITPPRTPPPRFALPSNLQGVGYLTPDMITAIFDDLLAPIPLQYAPTLAVDMMWDAKSLPSIQAALMSLGIATQLLGEKECILRFVEAPLSHGLRITGQPAETFGVAGAPLDHVSRVVWTHTEFESKVWKITCVEAVAEVLLYVLDVWRELAGRSGRFRPPPMSDEQLLNIYQSGDFSRCDRFDEARRAVERDCLLDAIVELSTPFGLRPQEVGKEKVVFETGFLAMKSVKVERLDRYFDQDIYGSFTSGRVVITGIPTTGEQGMRITRNLRLYNMLQDGGMKLPRKGFPEDGLVFCLQDMEETEGCLRLLLQYRQMVVKEWQVARSEMMAWAAVAPVIVETHNEMDGKTWAELEPSTEEQRRSSQLPSRLRNAICPGD